MQDILTFKIISLLSMKPSDFGISDKGCLTCIFKQKNTIYYNIY